MGKMNDIIVESEKVISQNHRLGNENGMEVKVYQKKKTGNHFKYCRSIFDSCRWSLSVESKFFKLAAA